MAADHPSLKSLWLDIMRLVSKQRQDTLVNNFMRNTKKSEKQEYEENMLMEGAVIHFPRNCLLAGQEINGVWLSLSLDGQERPKRLPYGTQCCEIPVDEIFNFLKHKPNNVELNGSTNNLEEGEAKRETFGKKKGKKSHLFEDEGKTLYTRDPESNSSNENPKGCSKRKKNQKRNKIKTEYLFSANRKTWKREDFLKDPDSHEKKSFEIKTEKSVEKSENMKDPLLFFETAYFFQQCTQYIRMVLISAWDHHVQWCKENLYEVPLSLNPIFQWKNEKLTSVSDVHPNLIVEVLVVGDIDLRMIKRSWYTVRKSSRARTEPTIGVLEPIKYFLKTRL